MISLFLNGVRFYQLLDVLFYCVLPSFIFYYYATNVLPAASWLKQSGRPESKSIKFKIKKKTRKFQITKKLTYLNTKICNNVIYYSITLGNSGGGQLK